MNEDPANPDPSSADAPGADEENLFAVALAKNNNESFPVLNAFQRFLDQERERARRRVVTMAVCFTGAMVVMLLVFGILFATFFSRMMVRNERQQDRLLDLVVAGLPGAARTEPAPVPPAVAPAPAPTEAPSAVTRDELLEILRQMNAAQAAPAPAAAPAAPAVVEIPVVPVPAETAAVPAPKPRKTGVISSPLRQDQEAKEAAEDAARRARAAAKAEAEAAAAAEAAKTAAVPAPEPAPEPAPATVAKEEKPADGKRTIAVKPRSRMKVPEGFSTDRAELQTSTGASVPFRLLVPVPDASR